MPQRQNLIRSACACGAAGLLALALAASSAPAHDDHAGESDLMVVRGIEDADPTEIRLLDLPLLDTEGRPLQFESEVIDDRIVAVNFIYTSCTTVCPVMSAIFNVVQDRLGEHLGAEVHLISLSIDPATDVPPRLKRYAEQFDAGPGWTFLTGDKSRMTQVLAGLGAFTPEFEEHPSMVLVGDPTRNVWRRLYGFVSPDEIVAELERLVAWRHDHQTDKENTQ